MKVRDMIKHLQNYNFDADFKIINNSHEVAFSFGTGYSNNVSNENCEEVYITINENNEK